MAIILVFADVNPLAFPAAATTMAAKVTTTFGTTFAKDLVYNRAMMVVDKADASAGTATNYAFVRSSAGTVSEIARTVFSVDAAMTKGNFSVGCLKTVGGVSTIENVLQTDHESTVFNNTSTIDSTQTSTISMGYNGIQFSTNTAAMFFGNLSQFRIRFAAGEGPNGSNLLAFESLATDGSYQLRTSISDGT